MNSRKETDARSQPAHGVVLLVFLVNDQKPNSQRGAKPMADRASNLQAPGNEGQKGVTLWISDH
jgi:hypothetical protein